MAKPGLIDTQLDRYAVKNLLGTGTFSAVYRAVHVHTGAIVALKVLKRTIEANGDDTVVERFLREARAAATVGNEHIVNVVDAGRTSDGLTFLALEFLEGSGLDTLQRAGPLPFSRAVEIGLQVLNGLEATHRAGIIHRDLKPANVFVLQRQGRDFVKLLDFGISKMQVDDVRSLTMTGVAMGTPAYMAPEQFVDAKSVDERADIYSVAVMLYELMAGRKPILSTSYAEAVLNVRIETAPPLSVLAPSVPKAISDCVMKGLEKEKGQRWQSAREFATALADAKTPPVKRAPQPPMEAKTILEAPPPAPIPAWQAKTVLGLEVEPKPTAPASTDESLPPEAAAFLRTRVPWWVWVTVAVAAAAFGAYAIISATRHGEPPPATDAVGVVEQQKLREDPPPPAPPDAGPVRIKKPKR